MLMLFGLRPIIEYGHPGKAVVRNAVPPPTPLAWPNSAVLLLIVIEFPAVQIYMARKYSLHSIGNYLQHSLKKNIVPHGQLSSVTLIINPFRVSLFGMLSVKSVIVSSVWDEYTV